MTVETQVVAVLCFGLGMVLQAMLMLRGSFQRGDQGRALWTLVGLVGLLPGKREREYVLREHILYALAIAGFMFAYGFRDRLLPRVGGRLVLAWNILLIAVAISSGWDSPLELVLLAIPTIPTVVNAFSDIDRHFGWKVFFNAWFTAIVVVIALVGYDTGPVQVFMRASDPASPVPSPLQMIVGGAAFLYVVANAWFVLALVPIKGRRQSWRDRWAEIRRHMDLLAEGYVWERDDPLRSLAVLVGLPALLFVAARWSGGDSRSIVPLALAIMPVLSDRRTDAPPPAPEPKRRERKRGRQ